MLLNDNAARTSSLSKLLFVLFMVFRETDEQSNVERATTQHLASNLAVNHST